MMGGQNIRSIEHPTLQNLWPHGRFLHHLVVQLVERCLEDNCVDIDGKPHKTVQLAEGVVNLLLRLEFDGEGERLCLTELLLPAT